MNYKARSAYKDSKIVNEYDSKRFYSIRGKIINFLEKAAIEKAIKYVALPAAAEILDLPCGTGRISLFLAQKGYKVMGGDISPEMIEKVRENARRIGMNGKTGFQVLDAEKIDCANSHFDAVVSLRFFGHTPPEVRKRVLMEFKRVGKKYFIFSYYLKNSLQEILRRKKRLAAGIPWYPVSFKDIDQEMKEVGIKKIKIFPVVKYFSETVVVLGEVF